MKVNIFSSMDSYNLGISAENRAIEYLQNLGWKIIKNRYKSPHGEIDILAHKGDMLIACEVKFRKHRDDAAYSVSDHQKERISNALQYFLSENECWIQRCPFCRFDVILLCAEGDLCHIENAWQLEN